MLLRCESLESAHVSKGPPKANVGMGQTRLGRSACLSPKVLYTVPRDTPAVVATTLRRNPRTPMRRTHSAATRTSSRVGAAAYNSVHTYVGPVVLGFAGVLAESSLATKLALIWFTHIGLDRALGYGLKYPTHFKDTHLQRV